MDSGFKPPPPKGPPPALRQSGNFDGALDIGSCSIADSITSASLLTDAASAVAQAAADIGWGHPHDAVSAAASSAVDTLPDGAVALSGASIVAFAPSEVLTESTGFSTGSGDAFMARFVASSDNAGTMDRNIQDADFNHASSNAPLPSGSGGEAVTTAASAQTPPALPMWDSGFYDEGAFGNASMWSSDGDVARIVSIHKEQGGEVNGVYLMSA
jgi:hypothetical protein